jgi:ribosome-binding protein aMBF1 (putative translation factor)
MSKMSGMGELMQLIEAEAEAGGPEEVAHLRALQQHYRLANQLAQARISRGLKQGQLATLSNVPQPEISRIESGKANPTESTLLALLGALNAELTVSLRRDLLPS